MQLDILDSSYTYIDQSMAGRYLFPVYLYLTGLVALGIDLGDNVFSETALDADEGWPKNWGYHMSLYSFLWTYLAWISIKNNLANGTCSIPGAGTDDHVHEAE